VEVKKCPTTNYLSNCGRIQLIFMGRGVDVATANDLIVTN
jgi:hypothetical protein